MEDPDDDVPLFPLGWKPREPESKEPGKALKNFKAPKIRDLNARREKREKRLTKSGRLD